MLRWSKDGEDGNGLGLPAEMLIHVLSFVAPCAACPVEEMRAVLAHRLVCQSWNELLLGAHFTDTVTVTGSSQRIRLLKYKGGLYITLPNAKENFSSYKVPTRYMDTMSDIRTRWFALRFDPENLTVNTGDYTFAKSTGYNQHHEAEGPFAATHVPFATCFGCESPTKDDGTAHVDLRGTPFAVLNKFAFAGCYGNGSWHYAHNDQVVALTGGGYCGWTAPLEVSSNEHLACNGGWHLKLRLVQTEDRA